MIVGDAVITSVMKALLPDLDLAPRVVIVEGIAPPKTTFQS
jgi:hypothetical protein